MGTEKQKYTRPVKIVKLQGFDLVIGGDAAVVKKSRELQKNKIKRKTNTISSLHNDSLASERKGIINHDLESNFVKKKKINLENKL